MKKIILFMTLLIVVIFSSSCFGLTNFGKNCGMPFHSYKNADEVMSLADKECNKFNYRKSINLYKQALKLNPSHPDEVYLKIGLNYILLDNYKKAVEPLTKSIELNPRNSSACYNRGYVYYKLKKIDNAKRDLKNALESNNFSEQSDAKGTKDLLSHIEFLESAE